jgi:hypothetical protein
MQKSALLGAIQQEIHRHDFSHFVDNPPAVAQGGNGIVVSGCPACRKRINSMSQFLDHLQTNDAMPALPRTVDFGLGFWGTGFDCGTEWTTVFSAMTQALL